MSESDFKTFAEDLENSRQKSDIQGQFHALNELGKAWQQQRQYRKALTYSRQALDLVKEGENPQDHAVALANLGCVFWEMAQLKKAMQLFREALPLAGNDGDDIGRTMLLTILGVSHWRKCEWKEALELFEQVSNAPSETRSKEKGGYDGLQAAIERGVAILKNRIRIAQEEHDPARILLPGFSLLPLLLFTGRKKEIPALLEKIIPLAQKLQRKDILDTIPQLQKLIKRN